jgi:8-demethyl-8-(2-methoxy-alpha-L-rhamnosyl)tetracenomycin-C 3'-O-methyltransferase
MQTLTEISAPLRTDKGTGHSYIAVYDMLFTPMREKPVNVLEIGITCGDCLKMWDQYFTNPSRRVWGCDIGTEYVDGRVKVLDSLDTAAVEREFAGMMFDIIIDDANHEPRYQLGTYGNFKTHLSPGGIYCIEDVAGLDTCAELFRKLDPVRTIGIIDLTIVKNRWDDALVVIRAKP